MLRKSIIIIIFFLSLYGCKDDKNNPIGPNENDSLQSKLYIENGFFLRGDGIGLIISFIEANIVTSDYLNSNLSLSISETSPHDTIDIIINGKITPSIDSNGIPIVDDYWGIRAHLRITDLIDTTFKPFDSLYYYSFIDSIKLLPYRLISQDTIVIENPWTLQWKSGYSIDTLKIKVYLKESSDLNYKRISGMNYDYVVSEFDSVNNIINYTVGIPTMNSQPNIFIDPYGKIKYKYENKYLNLETFFYYQQEKTLGTWEL